MNRTRAQRRYRKQGYTHEIAYLDEPFTRERSRYHKLLILIRKGHRTSWRADRKQLFPGEVIRPVATTYIHKGRKP